MIGAGYDFYRCFKCGRLITKLEEKKAFDPESKNKGEICPCGSARYSPCNLRWYHWFLPRVLNFAYLRYKGVA
jgi:DNA-directed RNA polymerase subunit RPC12/RpoP